MRTWVILLALGMAWTAPSFAAEKSGAVETRSAQRPERGSEKQAEKRRKLAKAAEQLSIAIPSKASETVELPKLDYDKIRAQKSAKKKQAMQVGIHRAITEELGSKWSKMARSDGRYSFRVVIHSPGAAFMRPHFTEDPAPPTEVYVYGEAGLPSLQGPVRKPAINRGQGFWGPVISGEYLYVEVVQDSGEEPPALRIDQISHGYTDPITLHSSEVAPESTIYDCHLDVSCYSWADGTNTGVARMLFEADGGAYVCTGALVMDQASSFRNWFLTANHCISSEASANSLISFLNFRTAYCDGPPPSLDVATRLNGASYVAGKSVDIGSDFALLELAEEPPGGTMYLGWTTADIDAGTSLVGIHHPAGTYQRISFGTGSSSAYSILTPYWEVVWSNGLTEGGSSGSPIMTYNDKRIVGQLFGHIDGVGGGTCSSPHHSFYGKFGVSWNDGLSQYLSAAATVFNDVPSTSIYAGYIAALANHGITQGCGNGNYCPSDHVTRGQMAAFIERSVNGETFSYTPTPYFGDVPANNVFFKYVQRLKDDGFTAMTGIFDVDGLVTRGQMAAFLVRALFGENFGYNQTPYYSDVPPGSTYFKYVQRLKDSGITATTGTYDVGSNVTREQMAAFLARAFLGMQ